MKKSKKSINLTKEFKQGIADGKKFKKLRAHYRQENEWTDYFKANPYNIISEFKKHTN